MEMVYIFIFSKIPYKQLLFKLSDDLYNVIRFPIKVNFLTKNLIFNNILTKYVKYDFFS